MTQWSAIEENEASCNVKFINWKDYFFIGKITGVQGLKGGLRVGTSVDSISSLSKNTEVLLLLKKKIKTFIIQNFKLHGKKTVLTLNGIENRDMADALKGAKLFINRDSLEELEDGVWYWEDIIGLKVYDIKNIYLGQVVSILPTGSNDVYVVRDNKKEILVPALEWVVKLIDIKLQKMIVDLPEGL